MRTNAARSAQPISGADTLGYTRVSKEDQAREDKGSLEHQRAAIKGLAERMQRSLPDQNIYEDAGASGGYADRPAFSALFAYCEANPRPPKSPGYVLVLNDSRWGRFADPEEATSLRFDLKRFGWRVKFVEQDDSDDPTLHGVIRLIGSAQAAEYRKQIRNNARQGARAAARLGCWQGQAPFGYRRVASRNAQESIVLEAGQRKADDQQSRLAPGPEAEQQIVRWLFTTYASGGYSLATLAREALRRWPAKRWGPQVIRAMLKNPAYVGDVVWCRRPADRDERQATPVRPTSEHEVARDAHAPLISRELFEDVQMRLARHARQKKAAIGDYVLSGLLTCAQCGKHYTGGGCGANHKNLGNDPRRYTFYKCSGSNGIQPVCTKPMGTVNKAWIEMKVVSEIGRVVGHSRVQQLIAAEVERALASTGEANADARKALERERDRLAAENKRVVRAVAAGVFTHSEAAAELKSIKQQSENTEAELHRLVFAGQTLQQFKTERDRLIALASDFTVRAKELHGAALGRLVEPWLESGVVDKERRTVVLTIRRVPNAGPFLQLDNMPGRG